jgi:proline iminopeptidase
VKPAAFALLLLASVAIGCALTSAPADFPREGFVTVEPGVRVAYRLVGSGPETLVTPWPSGSPGLDRLASDRGRRVIYYNPRGRLASDAVDPAKVSFENELSDLEAVRKHFGLEHMMLLGWSHYGMMTAVYTIRHPERVSRLVQMTPGTPRRTPYLDEGMKTMAARADAVAQERLRKRREAGEFAGNPEAYCREDRRVSLVAFVADPRDVEKLELDSCRFANEQAERQGAWWGALFGSMGDWDYRREAAALTVPRLVIQGEKDFIPMAGSREWAAGNPNARLFVIPGVGHFPHVEKPEVYFPAVETFLRGGWPDGAVAVSLSTVIPRSEPLSSVIPRSEPLSSVIPRSEATRDLSNSRDSSAPRASE